MKCDLLSLYLDEHNIKWIHLNKENFFGGFINAHYSSPYTGWSIWAVVVLLLRQFTILSAARVTPITNGPEALSSSPRRTHDQWAYASSSYTIVIIICTYSVQCTHILLLLLLLLWLWLYLLSYCYGGWTRLWDVRDCVRVLAFTMGTHKPVGNARVPNDNFYYYLIVTTIITTYLSSSSMSSSSILLLLRLRVALLSACTRSLATRRTHVSAQIRQ